MSWRVQGVNETRAMEAELRREQAEYAKALKSNMRKALAVYKSIWASAVDRTFKHGTSHGPGPGVKPKPSNWPKLRQTVIHTKFTEDTLSGRIIAAPYWYAVTQDYSRTISARRKKTLTIKVGDRWFRPVSVTIPKKPFIGGVAQSGEARAIAIIGSSFAAFTG